ncbi:MAG: hypothetical protein ACRDZR_08520 [Acidimicrobiales bacterium]
MATSHRQHQRPADHPGTTLPRHRTCRAPRLTLQLVRYLDLDHAHEETAVAALADLLAPYADPPEEGAA